MTNTLQNVLKVVTKWEEEGKVFFNRNSNGDMTIHVRDPRMWGGDPNRDHWYTAQTIEKEVTEAKGRSMGIKIDKQAGQLIITVHNLYKGCL
jgi:hypothetical protein